MSLGPAIRPILLGASHPSSLTNAQIRQWCLRIKYTAASGGPCVIKDIEVM